MTQGSIPPDNYSEIKLSTIKINKGDVLYHCFSSLRGFDKAVFFAIDDPKKKIYSGRFGDNDNLEGVCYFGSSMDVALVETLLQKNRVQCGVAEKDLELSCLMSASANRDLNLINLSGVGLHKNLVTAEITSCPHEISRLYSTKILRNKYLYDGIYWKSRLNNDHYCIALFERVEFDLANHINFGELNCESLKQSTAEILMAHGVFIY